MTFAAACLKMIRVGKIGRLGWINVIIESERSYTYADRTVIKEWVSGLPTWDGETGNTPPFYFDAYFNVKPSGILDPEEQAFPFNDAPNMPPSYGVKEFEGIPLGKFNIGNDISPIYMERIDGRDKYLACFTLFRGGASKKYKVAWAVRWEVKFGATIECDANKKPIVKLDPDALTRVNLRTVGDPKTVVSKVLGKSPSAELKMYERHKA